MKPLHCWLLLVPVASALSGCVSTAVGVVAGTTMAVGTAVVKAPIKVGGAVVGAMGDDDEEDN